MDGNRPGSPVRTLFPLSALLFLSWIVIAGLVAPGCREENALPVDRNIPPETFLTGAPGDSQTAFYAVRLFWSGFDQDGEVTGYEYAVTESLPDLTNLEYNYTTKTDSLFRFQVEEDREILAHRFYIRAIDDDGRRDPVPAWTFFGSRNTCAPEVIFEKSFALSPDLQDTILITSTATQAPSITDTVPAGWSTCFEWRGEDCDVILNPDGTVDQIGSIQRYFYSLSPLQFSDAGGTINDTTQCYESDQLSSGPFFLRVRAIDDAGFGGLDPTVRSFVVNCDPNSWFDRIYDKDLGDSVAVVFADSTGETGEFLPLRDGDTLPLPQTGVDIMGRVRGADKDGFIARYQVRIPSVSARYRTLVSSDPTFLYERLTTGDYVIQGRTIDNLERSDGTPAELTFYVNRAAKFVDEAPAVDFVQRPMEGETLAIGDDPTTMLLRFLAIDPDRLNATRNLVQYAWKFDFYPAAQGGIVRETFFSDYQNGNAVTRGGAWEAEVSLQDPDNQFIPGEYQLTVRAREIGDRTRQRVVTRTVRFTLVN